MKKYLQGDPQRALPGGNEGATIKGVVVEDVENALNVLGRTMPWWHTETGKMVGTGLALVSLFAIAYPFFAFVWFVVHINYAALALWPITVGLWVTSYKLACKPSKRQWAVDGHAAIPYAIITGIFAGIFSIATCVHYFNDLVGPRAPAPPATPAITSCKDHGGVKQPVHWDNTPSENGYTARWIPTMCNDGASLNDTPE